MNTEQPIHRLAQSRQRLASALLETSRRPQSPASAATPATTALLVEALQDGWARHPLHTGSAVAHGVANGLLQPMAQQHPWRLLFGAALAGAVLAGSRPWHWAVQPALRSALVQQVLRDLVLKALSRRP